jgi:hypothetical protein
MPIISRFYGIVIMMYFKEHHPPHFHARYEGSIAMFEIRTRRMIAGKLPPRARRLVSQWAKLHEEELLENWDSARKDGKLRAIEPLE